MSESTTKCITPDCNTIAKWKGLCGSCYGVAKKLIDANKTTWEELVKLGLAQVELKPFEIAFNKAKESNTQQPNP